MSIPVTLHIYDLIEQTPLCCGFFHTGVVVNGVEWCFGAGGGICGSTPLQNTPDNCRFREALVLGYIQSSSEVARALDIIRPEFPEETYSMVFNNCNDFSQRFCQVLLKGTSIPAYINRLAWFGRQIPFRFCIPPSMRSRARPQAPLLNAPPLRPVMPQSGGNRLGNSATTSTSTTGGDWGGAAGGGVSGMLSSAVTAPVRMVRGVYGRLTGARSTSRANEEENSSMMRDARELRLAAAQSRNRNEDGEPMFQRPNNMV